MNLLDAIMDIMAEAFDPHWGEAWSRPQIQGSLRLPNTHVIILDAKGAAWAEDSEPAGFLLSRSVSDEEELLLVAVKPAFRGIGLGAALIEIFVDNAQIRGADKLFLEMRENNPAINLYRKQGFEPIGRRRAYYTLDDGSTLDAITFVRKL